MQKSSLLLLVASASILSLTLASPTRADCKYWSDWAYDYECSDESPGVARIRNFAGVEYKVHCGLSHYDCAASNMSSQMFEVVGIDDVCDATEGLAIQVVASRINGLTEERDIQEFEYTPADDNWCSFHPTNAHAPWSFVALGCRVGFNCQ